eukprot:2111855-Rhodomonas_salina.5
MSGTDLAYGAVYGPPTQCPCMCLRNSYAMPGTDVAYVRREGGAAMGSFDSPLAEKMQVSLPPSLPPSLRLSRSLSLSGSVSLSLWRCDHRVQWRCVSVLIAGYNGDVSRY